MKILSVKIAISLCLCCLQPLNGQLQHSTSSSQSPNVESAHKTGETGGEPWEGEFSFEGVSCQRARCFYRIQPPGTLSPRYPYEAFRMYYYDRPYNAHQVDERTRHQMSSHSPKGQPYSHQVFRIVYDEIEPQIIKDLQLSYSDLSSNETWREQIARDRNLEYVDWQIHRDRRIVWEQQRTKVKLKGMDPEESLESQPVSSPTLKPATNHSPESRIHSGPVLNSR